MPHLPNDDGDRERFTAPLSVFGPVPVSDVDAVRAVLVAAAREKRAVSYSELLADLGHRFTRPKMRAICKTLDVIDRAGRTDGQPELAVLVVRESDGLPGQGWWAGEHAAQHGHTGDWTGPEATALVRHLQDVAFAYWQDGDAQATHPG